MYADDEFVHLNVHSDYSLQKSIASIPDIVTHAAALGQKAVALTDEGNLFGAAEFTKACREHGVRPILGCELWIASDRIKREDKDKSALIVLCKNETGFLNAKKLSSAGYLEGFYYVPRIDMDVLSSHAEGLICIIPQFDSEIAKDFEIRQDAKAEEKLSRLKDLFGANLFLELQNHGQTGEYQLNAQFASAGKKFGIPIVAGNDCYYVKKTDAFAHSIFIRNSLLQAREFHGDEHYIKSAQEMSFCLKDYPHSIKQTARVAEMCEFEMIFSGAQLPNFPIPPQFENADLYLRSLVFDGLARRYREITPAVRDRAEYELSVIKNAGFSGYFLIVWDIVSFANKSNIPVGLGRGSAAGSIAAYALGVTGIDPLKYDLLFERFLNPERISMPDIDTDFCVNGRQNIINYIREKYGADRVGQIITFSSLKPRGALRDAARAMNFSADEADEIAKLIPTMSKSLEEAKNMEPKLSVFSEERHQKLFEITDQILGVHRHASLHPAGVVIGNAPLIEYVPLYKDPKSGAVATQYTMDYLEECGLVKMDILGLRTVTIIAAAEKEIQKTSLDFSIENIPEDDTETFDALSEGKSDAVFQFESPGMQRALRDVRPTRIADLIALNALYRPGPMEHIKTYADVKHGRRAPEYHLNVLKSVLEETYGVIVYQEQVMQIARIIAGYSLGGADILRRAMGKKEKEKMQQQLKYFVDGACKNGYERKTAESIFKLLEPFAGYGFNKSHAAAYAVLAYRTAYLKQHYPQIFFMCQINAVASDLDSVTKYTRMAQSAGLHILPPDVNKSEYEFIVEGDALRFGLNAIKTISDDNKRRIPKERDENGPYTSVINVLERLSESRDMERFLHAAILSGLFDSVDSSRALLHANIRYLVQEGKARLEAGRGKRILLFSENEDENIEMHGYPNQTEVPHVLLQEREYIGIYLTVHPLNEVKEIWEKETTLDLSALRWVAAADDSSRFSKKTNHYLICYIDKVYVRIKNHEKIYSGIAEDFRGSVEFVYKVKAGETEGISERTVYALVGQLNVRDDEKYVFWVSSAVQDISAVHKARAGDKHAAAAARKKAFKYMHIAFRSADTTEQELKTIYEVFSKNLGNVNVVLHMPKIQAPDEQSGSAGTAKQENVINLPPNFMVKADDQQFVELVRAFPCVEKVWCL